MVDWKMLQGEMRVHAVDFVRKEAKEAVSYTHLTLPTKLEV